MRRLVEKMKSAWSRTPAPAAVPTRPQALLIGHSHAYAIWRGYHTAPPAFELRFFDMLAAGVAEAIAATADGIVPALQEFVAASPDAPVLLTYGGNEHNLLALVEHPAPYDFHHPQGAPADPRRWLVPAAAMHAFFAPYTRRLADLMAGFRKAFPERAAWVVLPPPPMPDNQHIVDNPYAFAEKIAESGVAPYAVRHKVWLLQCELMRAAAAAADLEVLEVPASTLDDAGRLLPQAWGQDAVHASVWYGEQVLQAFAAVVAADAEAGA